MMLGDAELIKAGTEGLVEGALKPYHDLILRLFGPAVDEAAIILKDYVKYVRERQKRFFKATQHKLDEAHIKPQPVPLKLLKSIIENASTEESDELQDIWATLLVSAVDPNSVTSQTIAAFVSVLRDLTVEEVKFLDAWYEEVSHEHFEVEAVSRAVVTDRRFILSELLPTFTKAVPITYRGVGNSHLEIAVENLTAILAVLVRHGLILKTVEDPAIIRIEPSATAAAENPTTYTLTDFGVMFVAACRGTKTKA